MPTGSVGIYGMGNVGRRGKIPCSATQQLYCTPRSNAKSTDNNSTTTVDANAPPTDVPASPLQREVPRRLGFAAPIATSAVALLLCLISLATTGCAPSAPSEAAPILLFNGTGVSVNDVAAIESILQDRGLDYSTANSEQLNGMSEAQLRAYRLLIVPGGNYIEMGDGFSPETSQESVRRCRMA